MYASQAATSSGLNVSPNPSILAAMTELFPARRDLQSIRTCEIIDIISIICIINVKGIIRISDIIRSVLMLSFLHHTKTICTTGPSDCNVAVTDCDVAVTDCNVAAWV